MPVYHRAALARRQARRRAQPRQAGDSLQQLEGPATDAEEHQGGYRWFRCCPSSSPSATDGCAPSGIQACARAWRSRRTPADGTVVRARKDHPGHLLSPGLHRGLACIERAQASKSSRLVPTAAGLSASFSMRSRSSLRARNSRTRMAPAATSKTSASSAVPISSQ